MNRRTAAVFGFIALIESGLSAQVPAPQSFGTDEEGISIIGFQDFFPERSEHGYLDSGIGERRSDAQDLIAGINMIPNGALLVQVVFYVRDSDGDATDDIEGRLCRTYVDSGSGEGLSPACLGTPASTSGAPGETTLVLAPDRQIVYREDVTNDGNPDVVNYYVKVTTRGNTFIRMARLLWRRQVSPAPSTATFADVPTGHPFFQFIEALSKSGITAGCNGEPPLYCPDAPLTRGQMAVFLAKALGLHWSWISPN